MDKSLKETAGNRLGRLLAHLGTMDHPEKQANLKQLSAGERQHLEQLSARRDHLLKNDFASKILRELPTLGCLQEKAFLEQNPDFFIYHVLAGGDDADPGFCRQLTVHLNNCFRCFNAYVEVLDDYHEAQNGKSNQEQR